MFFSFFFFALSFSLYTFHFVAWLECIFANIYRCATESLFSPVTSLQLAVTSRLLLILCLAWIMWCETEKEGKQLWNYCILTSYNYVHKVFFLSSPSFLPTWWLIRTTYIWAWALFYIWPDRWPDLNIWYFTGHLNPLWTYFSLAKVHTLCHSYV